MLLLVAAVALVMWVSSGLYNVSASEVAIVERLGQYITTPDGHSIMAVGPGLHMGPALAA